MSTEYFKKLFEKVPEHKLREFELKLDLLHKKQIMKKITDLSHIDYKTNPEGRLLFAALVILTVHLYPNQTSDEVIDILNKKADSFLKDN